MVEKNVAKDPVAHLSQLHDKLDSVRVYQYLPTNSPHQTQRWIRWYKSCLVWFNWLNLGPFGPSYINHQIIIPIVWKTFFLTSFFLWFGCIRLGFRYTCATIDQVKTCLFDLAGSMVVYYISYYNFMNQILLGILTQMFCLGNYNKCGKVPGHCATMQESEHFGPGDESLKWILIFKVWSYKLTSPKHWYD